MSKDTKIVEIVDAETSVSTAAIPKKATGYLAFYQNNTGKWEMVTQFTPNAVTHPILPYWAHESKQDAVAAAMGLAYAKPDFIKIVAVDFEV